MNGGLIERLSAVCREHLLREKILIVPSLAIGHQIADAIAHGGAPWVNLRAETIRTLSDAIAGFALAQEGKTVLSRAQALALVERACDEALEATSYFAALKDRPGLHRAIQKSIDDLRHAGIRPDDLPASAFEEPRKAADLTRILAAYDRALNDGHYVDRYGVLSRAVAMLESGTRGPWAPNAIWMVVGELELTAIEEKLLTLAGAGALQRLQREDPEGAPDVEFRRAAGEENEVRAAFRTILAESIPFDDAEIVYTVREPYLALAFELASEHGVPCTFADGIASQYTRPGQAALHFLRWIGEGWQANALQRAARAGVLKFGPGTIGGRAFARILRAASVGWGRDRHLERIDVLLAEKREGLKKEKEAQHRERIERAIVEAEQARDVVRRLLVLSEEVATGETIDPAAVARATQRFLAEFGATRNEVDGMASAGLQRMLEELSVLPAMAAQRDVVASRLAEAVRQLHVAASNPRPGHLHVAPIRAGGWSARRRMFVFGADDSRHPGRGLQDPIVLDSERALLNLSSSADSGETPLSQPAGRQRSGGLPLLGDAPRRATEQWRRLLARSGARALTVSFSELDLKERRDHFPAPAFLDLYRRKHGDPHASYAEIVRAVARESFVGSHPLSGSEWWLMRRFAGGPAQSAEGLRAAVLAAYPTLASGAEAEAERASERLTKWDGRIDAPDAELDPRKNGRIYSASQLEMMASCPYRYFLARILHVEPLDELTFEPDTWLEAREFGTMLHDVLQNVMNQLCEAGHKPAVAHLEKLEPIAENALRTWRRLIPPPSEAAFERRRVELLRSLAIFLRNEEDVCREITPRFFEVSFGFGEESAESIAMPEPVSIPLGGGAELKLRGRIDRVDHDETRGEWNIWDYKSGSSYDFDQGGSLQRGRKMQHAIYARALDEMLRRKGMTGRVARSGYFFPTPKGRGARIARVSAPGELEHALNALFDTIGRGYFPHADENVCKYCEFRELCGGVATAGTRTASKVAANPDDPAVAAWQRLQGIR